MTYLRFFILCAALFLGSTQFFAQGHEDVFPGSFGTEAQNQVANAFTPNNILNYNNARDTLFRRVLAKNDSLTCVYSGHKVYMDPSKDPTTTVYQNGGTNGINTEHTWPQSYGAGDGDARSNMYHLFPTRIKVNEARASFPFSEITDSQTQAWYYLNQVQSNTPTSNIERFSEYRQGMFEPREDFKGDIARAMFYFYTIYNSEAQSAPATWFPNQISTLYQWHLQDPVDESEWIRNIKIAPYQSNKSNPYILDSSLVARVFCTQLNLACTTVSTTDLKPKFSFGLTCMPNPVRSNAQIQYELPQAGEVSLRFYNAMGQELEVLNQGFQGPGLHQITWQKSSFPTQKEGIIFCHLNLSNNTGNYSSTKRIILLP